MWGAALNDNPGDSASARGLGSGDLGIPYARFDGGYGYVFGDSWTGPGQTGDYMGSPVLLTQKTFDPSGKTPIGFDGPPVARQLLDYAHRTDNGYGYEVSRIPNDAIEIGGRTWMQCTVVRDWNPPPGDDGAACSLLLYSDDHGQSWNYGLRWLGDDFDRRSPYMKWSFAGYDSTHLYIVASRWGRVNRDGPILVRCHVDDILNQAPENYENWTFTGGQWSWQPGGVPACPIFPGMGAIGELSCKRIADRWVMAYFDCDHYCICTRTAPAIDTVWMRPKPQIWGQRPWWMFGVAEYPQLYGGYIHPGSPAPDSITLLVSQWNTNSNRPYRVMQFDGIDP